MDSPDHWERPGAPSNQSSWDQPAAASQSSSRPDWDQDDAQQNGGASIPEDFRRPSTTGSGTNEQALREGFTRGRVVWFGGRDAWEEDWWFYVSNEHTLISICRGHAMHHFERFD